MIRACCSPIPILVRPNQYSMEEEDRPLHKGFLRCPSSNPLLNLLGVQSKLQYYEIAPCSPPTLAFWASDDARREGNPPLVRIPLDPSSKVGEYLLSPEPWTFAVRTTSDMVRFCASDEAAMKGWIVAIADAVRPPAAGLIDWGKVGSRIPIAEIEIGQYIAQGAEGSVHRGRWGSGAVALKIVYVSREDSAKM